jgi:hypothetical protein
VITHGELQLTHLLDIVEFVLVAVLGFMPLIVIHWADRRPRFSLPRPKRRLWRLAVTTKTSLLLLLTDWSLTISI